MVRYGGNNRRLCVKLNSFGILAANSFSYQFLNLSGAIGVMLISFAKKTYQPAILNVIWGLVAAVAIVNIVFAK